MKHSFSFRLACRDDKSSIVRFLDEHWGARHPLVHLDDFFTYYYEDGDDATNGVYKIDFVEESALVSQNSVYEYDAQSGAGSISEDVVLGTGSVSGLSEEFGLATGDIIRSFIIGRDGENVEYEIDRTFDISDLLYILRPDDTLTVKYERDGREDLTTSAISLQASDFASVA